MTGTKVALYARISEDQTGEGAGVARQLDEARALAKAKGWDVVHEFTDNSISGLTGKHRPGYEALRSALEQGAVEQIVVWQTSRLWRNRGERARDIEMLAKQRVGVIAVKGPSLDLSTAYGRGMAGLLGEFDTLESEVKSERVAAAAAQRAKQGRPNGPLGYGWRRQGDEYVIVPEQAEIVREIVRRLIARESLRAVTADLNERGVPAPKTAAWGKTSVKKIALRPSNVALLIRHRGQPDEELLPGCWPPLIDREQWDHVRAVLSEPARRDNATTRPGARKHLLSWGLGQCGVCGGRLRVSLKGNQRWGTKSHLYVCDDKGCTGRNQGSVDELVRAVVVARLQRADALDWLMGDDEAAQTADKRARELRGRLEDAAEDYADGTITRDQMKRITALLTPEIEQAEADRDRHAGSRDLDLLREVSGPRAGERWDELEVSQRRALLEALGMAVIIDKVKRRGPGFDPESVRIEWRGQA